MSVEVSGAKTGIGQRQVSRGDASESTGADEKNNFEKSEEKVSGDAEFSPLHL